MGVGSGTCPLRVRLSHRAPNACLCSGVVSYRLRMDLQPQLQTAGLHSALWRTPSSQRHYTLQQVIAQTWDGPAPFPLPGRGWCQHHPLITHSPILFCLFHTRLPPRPGLSFALPSPSPTSPCLSPIVLSSHAKGWSDAFHRCSAGSFCCSLRFRMALRCWAAVSWQF